MDEMHKHYQILGLKPEASEKEIVEAYKVLVKVWNPDRFKDDPNIQKIATEKIKEIDDAFKQLLIGAENRQEKGEEILDPQVEVETEPPETRESLDVKADPRQELIVKVGNVTAKLKLEEPESGKVWKDPYTGMEFVFVRGGSFQMGDILGDGSDDEKPVHEVTVGSFWIEKYPVTQGKWGKVMGNNPSHFKSGHNYPVESISWNDAQEFIHRLNQKTGKRYRLPTEAEWEYAARSGGKREKWAGTSSESELGDYAWYHENSGVKPNPVGGKKPNGLGLYDMSGNVWEWCEDWYDEYYYKSSPKDNPKGADSGQYRVLRGGSWYRYRNLRGVRTSCRDNSNPSYRSNDSGVRLVLPAQPEQTSIAEMVGLSSLPIKEQPPAPGEKPYGTPIPSLIEPRHEPSSKPFQKEDLKDGIKQTVVSPHIVEYAGFWKRFAASLIDSILISIVTFIVYLIFGIAAGASGGNVESGILIGWIMMIIVNWLYWVIMESSPEKATLGKMALGIIVTDYEGKGISFGRATGRYFAKIISALILLIGFIMAGFTQKKQALHDIIADCLVVVKK